MKVLNKDLIRKTKLHDMLINALKIVQLRKLVGYVITAYEVSLLILKNKNNHNQAFVGDAISIIKESANFAIGIGKMDKCVLFRSLARIILVLRKYYKKIKL